MRKPKEGNLCEEPRDVVLRARGLSFTYAPGTPFEKTALEDFNLEVKRGEFVVIAGATGSGKSTILQLAGALLPVGQGELDIEGISVSTNVGEVMVRKNVGLAFQFPETQLFAETVADDIAFGPRNQAKPDHVVKDIVERAMVQVGLPPAVYKDRNPLMLSGGEQRRVALAGVLSISPKLLLLDEPTVGLDHMGRRTVKEILLRLKEEHSATIIVVTHDVEEYTDLADRFVLINEGRSVLDGDLRTLSENIALLEQVGVRIPPFLTLQSEMSSRGNGAPETWTTYRELVEHYLSVAEQRSGLL